jgi:serine/threonine kinase 32
LRHAIGNQTIHFSGKGRKGRTISVGCITAMEGFLCRDPSQRLGAGAAKAEENLVMWGPEERGIAGIQTHPFFADLDWHRLERKELQPAYVPDVSDVCVCVCMGPHIGC